MHGEDFQEHNSCSEIRRCAVVALTNLTFGNERIKSFLCASEGFIPVMLCNLQSPFENLRKATAHLFRNLAWKADRRSRKVLSDSDVVRTLLAAAMDAEARLETAKRSSGTEAQGEGKEETTLKIMLSALWNLSAHCSKNKVREVLLYTHLLLFDDGCLRKSFSPPLSFHTHMENRPISVRQREL